MGQIKKRTRKRKNYSGEAFPRRGTKLQSCCGTAKDPDTKKVHLWVRRYREEGLSGLKEKRGKSSSSMRTGRPRQPI